MSEAQERNNPAGDYLPCRNPARMQHQGEPYEKVWFGNYIIRRFFIGLSLLLILLIVILIPKPRKGKED
jgi:hypothetical protein